MAFDKQEIKQLEKLFGLSEAKFDKKLNTLEGNIDKKFVNFRIDIYSDMQNLLSPIKNKVYELDKKIDKVKEMLEGDVNAAYEDIDNLKSELEILKIKVAKLEAMKH